MPRVYRRVDVEGGGEPGLGEEEGEEATISPVEESSHQPAMVQWRQRTNANAHADPSSGWSRQE